MIWRRNVKSAAATPVTLKPNRGAHASNQHNRPPSLGYHIPSSLTCGEECPVNIDIIQPLDPVEGVTVIEYALAPNMPTSSATHVLKCGVVLHNTCRITSSRRSGSVRIIPTYRQMQRQSRHDQTYPPQLQMPFAPISLTRRHIRHQSLESPLVASRC